MDIIGAGASTVSTVGRLSLFIVSMEVPLYTIPGWCRK